MKPNEYIRHMGIDRAKREVGLIGTIAVITSDKEWLSELKRLVESHDLVQEWKLPEDDESGLDGAHLYLDCYAYYTSDKEKAKLDRLNQAIADVESCQ